MRLRGRLGAHPAEDLLGIGQEGEDGRWRGSDLGLPPDDKRFIHLLTSLKQQGRPHRQIVALSKTNSRARIGVVAGASRHAAL